MARLPDIPQNWNDHFAAPQRADLDLSTGSEGLLGGWRQPDWNLENSGIGILLHPQTVAQIDFKVSPVENSIYDPMKTRASQREPIEGIPLSQIGHVAGNALSTRRREPPIVFTVPIVEMPTAKLDDLGPLPPLLPPHIPYSPSPFEKGMDALGRGPVGRAWNQFTDVAHDALRSEWGDRILTAVEKTAKDFKDKGDWLE